MRRTKEDTELTRLRILDAAERAFCAQGYAAAKMDAIAGTVGVTKGAIFWHFQSKAALFHAVFKRSVARIFQIFEEQFSTADPILEKCRRVLIETSKDRAFEVLLAFGNPDTDELPAEILSDMHKSISSILEVAHQKLEAARLQGELRPDTNLSAILGPFIMVMSGFGKMREVKKILGPAADAIDGETAITMLFTGLFSFQCEK